MDEVKLKTRKDILIDIHNETINNLTRNEAQLAFLTALLITAPEGNPQANLQKEIEKQKQFIKEQSVLLRQLRDELAKESKNKIIS